MVGGSIVFYRVRRQHGKYYLIKEWYDDVYKKKRSKSLGNCETIEKLLEKLNNISPQELEQIINTTRNSKWCGGWDLNPRRPTPSGPKPHSPLPVSTTSISNNNHGFPSQGRSNITVMSGKTVVPQPSESELKRFLEWCLESASRSTCEQYVGYLRKPLDLGNKWSRLAWKKYFKFIGREDLWKQIKVKKSGVDLYIPSDKDVLTALEKACSSSEELCWIYKLLVYSGLRLEEVVRVLNEAEQSRWIQYNIYYKYPLAWKRGSKQAFYCYSLEKPPTMLVSAKWVSNWASKNKILSPKYIRKWVATKMLGLGIPEEIVNFIQGRIPQEILSKHYLKLTTLADQYYQRYAQWLQNNFLKMI